MKQTAWHDQKMPEKMMQTNFPHILYSDHFGALKKCFDSIEGDANNLLDLGCGKAEISDAFPKYKYCGADLPHMIQKVSKILKPSLKYIEFDAIMSDMNFVSSFDIVVMNSFLSEIDMANEILCKVLKFAPKYVVIHRQEIKDRGGREEYLTYGGLKTTKYIFDRNQLDKTIESNNFTKLFETDCPENLKSLILKNK